MTAAPLSPTVLPVRFSQTPALSHEEQDTSGRRSRENRGRARARGSAHEPARGLVPPNARTSPCGGRGRTCTLARCAWSVGAVAVGASGGGCVPRRLDRGSIEG